MKLNIILILLSIVMILHATSHKRVFINGKIYTVNPGQPYAEALVVVKNRIAFVGTNEQAEKYVDEETETINLDGKLVLPGFIDAHAHFIKGGFSQQNINLRNVKSPSEFRQLIKDYVSIHQREWITGGNWDQEQWNIKELPTRQLIDDITNENPVFLERTDLHMGLANSLALKMAGIDRNTPDPPGGLIVKDSHGEPTGILKDNAITLLKRYIPEPDEADIRKAAFTAMDYIKQFGITGIHDISENNDLPVYNQLDTLGLLTCRIYSIYPIISYNDLVNGDIHYGEGSEKLKRGALKAFADGSLGSGTAWFFDPYINKGNYCGLPTDLVLNGQLDSLAIEADKHKLQICIHAIGDKANKYVLDLYKKIHDNNPPWDRRDRIEHAQHLRKEDFKLFKNFSIIASVQPYHLMEDGVWAEKKIGKQRTKLMYAFKSLLDNGVKLCFGSDWTVAPINPLLGIYAAVTRRTIDGKNPDGWNPEQKISVEDAIKCYTINNAYASYQEKDLGSIEPGKFADFIVLSDDILTIEPEKIKEAKVIITVFNGEIIYR
jgi:predicted amidohydrolase YtcJ